jgi:hypothetical protein
LRARARDEQLANDGIARQNRAARLLELIGFLLGGLDEVLEGFVGRVGPHHDERRLEHKPRDRR